MAVVVGRYHPVGLSSSPLKGLTYEEMASVAVTDMGAKQNEWELTQLVTLIGNRRPTSILEIGSAEGGTLVMWIACSSGDATIVSVDLANNPRKALGWQSYLTGRQELIVIQGDSNSPETVELCRATLPAGADFLFIDGSHWYDPVRKDYDSYTPLIRPGGIVALHDIVHWDDREDMEVWKIWEEEKDKYRYEEFIAPTDECGIGVLYVRR